MQGLGLLPFHTFSRTATLQLLFWLPSLLPSPHPGDPVLSLCLDFRPHTGPPEQGLSKLSTCPGALLAGPHPQNFQTKWSGWGFWVCIAAAGPEIPFKSSLS